MLESETILELTKKSNYKSLHLANLDKRYSDNNNKNIKMLNVKYIILIGDFFINNFFINKCNISI